jgi:hypothetical protein
MNNPYILNEDADSDVLSFINKDSKSVQQILQME